MFVDLIAISESNLFYLFNVLKAVRRLAQGAASSFGGFDSGGSETILGKCAVESERQSVAADEDSSEDSFLSYDEEEYAKDAYC